MPPKRALLAQDTTGDMLPTSRKRARGPTTSPLKDDSVTSITAQIVTRSRRRSPKSKESSGNFVNDTPVFFIIEYRFKLSRAKQRTFKHYRLHIWGVYSGEAAV